MKLALVTITPAQNGYTVAVRWTKPRPGTRYPEIERRNYVARDLGQLGHVLRNALRGRR